MPSRSAHRAALRRSKEPGVIAPEGITLPELPKKMGWRNPMRDYDYVRDEWELYRLRAEESINLVTIRRVQPDAYAVSIASQSGAAAPQTLFTAAEAFAMASEWARKHDSAP